MNTIGIMLLLVLNAPLQLTKAEEMPHGNETLQEVYPIQPLNGEPTPQANGTLEELDADNARELKDNNATNNEDLPLDLLGVTYVGRHPVQTSFAAQHAPIVNGIAYVYRDPYSRFERGNAYEDNQVHCVGRVPETKSFANPGRAIKRGAISLRH